MDEVLKENLISKSKWLRFFFMVIFAIVNYVAQCIIWVIAAAQFIWSLFTNQSNQNLLHFGQGLSAYSYQIMRFLTYNTEEKPYPFGAWPSAKE